MKISYLIATRNRRENILNLIRNISIQLNSDIEIIVLDNGSNDETYDALKKLGIKELKIIRSENNLGLISFLELAKKASGEVFTYLSDEDCINLNLNSEILQIFESNKLIDVYMGSVVYGDKWSLVQHTKKNKILNISEKVNNLLNFSGLAGIYIRKQSYEKSIRLKEINFKNAYSYWNYYPIGMIALESCSNNIFVSNQIVACQSSYAQTTNLFVSDHEYKVLTQSHYYPISIVDRFKSKINWINGSNLKSLTKSKLKAFQLFYMFQQMNNMSNANFLKTLENDYGNKVLQNYLSAVDSFKNEVGIFSTIINNFFGKLDFIGKLIFTFILIKMSIKYIIRIIF